MQRIAGRRARRQQAVQMQATLNTQPHMHATRTTPVCCCTRDTRLDAALHEVAVRAARVAAWHDGHANDGGVQLEAGQPVYRGAEVRASR